MSEKVLYIFAYVGVSLCIYVIARLIGRTSKKLDDEDRRPRFAGILSIISIILMLIAFPAFIMLFPLEISESLRRSKEADDRIAKMHLHFPDGSFNTYVFTMDDLEEYAAEVRNCRIVPRSQDD